MLFSCSSLATEITGSYYSSIYHQKQKTTKFSLSQSSSLNTTYSPLLNLSSQNNNRTTSPKSLDFIFKNSWKKLGKESLFKTLSAEQINFYLTASESEKQKERQKEAKEAKEFGYFLKFIINLIFL
jgi:hypothetical protein